MEIPIFLASLLIFANGHRNHEDGVASRNGFENEVVNITAAIIQERRENLLLKATLDKCRKGWGETVETSIACEWTPLRIACTHSNKVINILSANYGRTHPGSIVCPNVNAKNTNCFATNSMSILKTRCQGKRDCEVPATNAVFGDPCAYTFKYLKVEFTCVKPL